MHFIKSTSMFLLTQNNAVYVCNIAVLTGLQLRICVHDILFKCVHVICGLQELTVVKAPGFAPPAHTGEQTGRLGNFVQEPPQLILLK